MTETCLELDHLLLSCNGERITLAVTSFAAFQTLDICISQLASIELLDWLRSGNIWVSRGNGCCLNFNVLLDDAPLTQTCGHALLETLGLSIRDAPLWSQLPLSPTLELSNQTQRDTISFPDFSIKMARSLPCSNSIKSSSISSEPTETLIPHCFPHVQLMRVEVSMSFYTADKMSRKVPKGCDVSTTSKISLSGDRFDDAQGQLLETKSAVAKGLVLEQHLDELANAGRRLSQASHIIDKAALSIINMCADASFPRKIDIPEISPLLSNAHKRYQILIPQPPKQCLKPKHKAINTVHSNRQVCCSGENRESPMHDSRIARKMVEFSMLCLVGGRQTKSHPMIKLLKPYPEICLSEIARPLWSPGFGHVCVLGDVEMCISVWLTQRSKDMSQRSRFLSTISSALSESLIQNSQSPLLRMKLRSLKAQPDSDSTKLQRVVETDEIDQIRRAIQLQLFRMMQVSLYDPMSARRLPTSAPDSYFQTSKLTDEGSEMILDSDENSGVIESMDDGPSRFVQEPCTVDFPRHVCNYDTLLLDDGEDFENLLFSEGGDFYDSLLEADMEEIWARSRNHLSSWNDEQQRQGSYNELPMQDGGGIGVRIGDDGTKWDGERGNQMDFNDLLESALEETKVSREEKDRDAKGRNEPRFLFEDIVDDWNVSGELENQNMLV